MAIQTDDVFAMAAFDPAKISDSVRDFAEKGAAQSKEAYAKMKTAAEDATKTVEATVQSFQAGTAEIGKKTIDTLRSNAETSFAHIEALMGVKSVAELFELQSAFVRKAYETSVEQAKDLQETVKKVSETVTAPAKVAAEKAFASFKVA